MRRYCAMIGVGVSLFSAVPALAFDVPANDGFVTDTVPLLSQEREQALEEQLTAYREETSNEIAIVIVNTLDGEPAADVAVDIGRRWGVGQRGRNNGVIVLVAYQDHEMFIAPGYGLEGVLPDIVVKGILEEDVLPLFRAGKYEEGIQAAVDDLQKHIAGEYTADRYAAPSGEWFSPALIVLLFVLFDVIAFWLGRTKEWWLGGVLGGVTGIVLVALFSWWISIPILVILGLLLDYLASRNRYGQNRRRRRGGRGGFGGGFGGGRGGGGFGGFSGGGLGGGGAGGKW